MYDYEWLDEIFGYLGSTLLIISLLPQLHKSYKSKSLIDISGLTLGFQICTSSLLLTYGIIINEIPMIYGNSGVLIELLLLSYAKIKFKGNKNNNDNYSKKNEDDFVYFNNSNLSSLSEYSNCSSPNSGSFDFQTFRKRIPTNEYENHDLYTKSLYSVTGETSV